MIQHQHSYARKYKGRFFHWWKEAEQYRVEVREAGKLLYRALHDAEPDIVTMREITQKIRAVKRTVKA